MRQEEEVGWLVKKGEQGKWKEGVRRPRKGKNGAKHENIRENQAATRDREKDNKSSKHRGGRPKFSF